MDPFINYLKKMRGGKSHPPRAPWQEILWSCIGSFMGIYAIYAIAQLQALHLSDVLFLIGSFGASAILIYGVPNSPYAQPRNLIGGHLLSALAGVSCAMLFEGSSAVAAAMAVSLAMLLMHLTRSIHPPGGATALIAVIGSQQVHELGFWYLLTPVGVGALIMLVVAVLFNNLSPYRRYPQYWY